MGNTVPLSFRVTREEENFLKAEALRKGMTLSAYAKNKVFSAEQPLNRLTIEAEIDELKHSISSYMEKINHTMNTFIQRTEKTDTIFKYYSVFQRELMIAILKKASDDDEWMEYTYKNALEKAKQAIKPQ